ncbi:4-trimethylaminobutyraldehyde dehydrogenase [Sigmodon hispidus]
MSTCTFVGLQPLTYRDGAGVELVDSIGTEKAFQPATGRVIVTLQCSGQKEVDLTVKNAKVAFKIWHGVLTSPFRGCLDNKGTEG